jgi:hypothetical protein
MSAALDSLFGIDGIPELIDSVYITGTASPVGRSDYNLDLSCRRGYAMLDYLVCRYPGIGREKYVIRPVGIDWEGFRSLMDRDPLFPYRDEILALVNSRRSEDAKLWLLRSVGGISTQSRLITGLYPLLQYVSVRIKLSDGRFIHADEASPIRQLVEDTDWYRPGVYLLDTAGTRDPIPEQLSAIIPLDTAV